MHDRKLGCPFTGAEYNVEEYKTKFSEPYTVSVKAPEAEHLRLYIANHDTLTDEDLWIEATGHKPKEYLIPTGWEMVPESDWSYHGLRSAGWTIGEMKEAGWIRPVMPVPEADEAKVKEKEAREAFETFGEIPIGAPGAFSCQDRDHPDYPGSYWEYLDTVIAMREEEKTKAEKLAEEIWDVEYICPGPDAGVMTTDEYEANGCSDPSEAPEKAPKALTGGASDYYLVDVKSPTRASVEPYVAECNDIIKALDMTYAEGNIFKALWRVCRQKQGFGKPGTTAQYDVEKILFFAKDLARNFGLTVSQVKDILGYLEPDLQDVPSVDLVEELMVRGAIELTED